MQEPVVPETRITSAEFGDYHYQEFLAWAFADRQSKAALLRNMAVARTDANQALLDRKLKAYARLYKLTVEELQRRILAADGANQSLVELHRQLAAEAELTKEEVKHRQPPTSEY